MTTPGTLLERAKQGEAEAIATLMNQTLSKQKSRIRVLRQGNNYKLLIESEQVPPQTATVQWITQGLKKLAIPHLERAMIYGKLQHSSKPDWQQCITLTGACPETVAGGEKVASEKAKSVKTECEQAGNANESGAACVPEGCNDTALPSQPPEPLLDLTEHCFTRNKSLLKGNLTLPSKAVIQLVLSFHGLTNAQKQAVLPFIDKALLNKPNPGVDNMLGAEAKTWLAQIPELEGPDSRKASIWLSRYCLAPMATVDQLDIKPVEPTPEADSTEDATPEDTSTFTGEASSSAPPFPTTHHHQSQPSSKVKNAAASARQPQTSGAFLNTTGLPLWVIPTVWSVCLLIVIALGINSVKAADDGYAVCDDTLGSAESCMLAVQLTGHEILMNEVIESADPFITPSIKEAAIARCSEEGYFIASEFFDDDYSQVAQGETLTINSSTTEELFPGVLLTLVSQTDSQTPEASSRMACLDYATTDPSAIFEYGNSREEGATPEVALVSADFDEIPANWPDEPYEGLAAILQSFERFEGVYNVVVSFGSNTLFTAVGLVMAVIFCSCYRCHTLNGIYKTSLVLGILETLIFMLPRGGLFSTIAMEVSAIGITSLIVKEFDVDWTYGYGSLMLGAVTMMAVRFVLNMTMYSVIAHIIFLT